MSMNDIDKSYVSPYDRFMYAFDRDHEKSESQKKEIKKHERIARLRDNAVPLDKQEPIWTEF
ncbi:CBU_0585 family protein [Legionella sp. CNM-4043-24]|uniref:CBU_0585 family protein n=1 Tax=Legionella sp. CNM-4043-24 TaxID=3421646 RepID=UPI00403AE2E7